MTFDEMRDVMQEFLCCDEMDLEKEPHYFLTNAKLLLAIHKDLESIAQSLKEINYNIATKK